MVVILRHDVDNGYVGELGFGTLRRKFVWSLNYYREYGALGDRLPGIVQLKYLHDASRLLEVEENLGIRGSWFFRTRTKPYPALEDRILDLGGEVSFHADHTLDEKQFLSDMKYTLGESTPLGFTKHGSEVTLEKARNQHVEVYDASNCLALAKMHNFKYFSGNGTAPEQPSKIIGGVLYFPNAFWMDPSFMNDSKYTLDWLKRMQKDTDIVVLVHPREYTDLFPKIQRKIDSFFEKIDEVTSFASLLKSRRLI